MAYLTSTRGYSGASSTSRVNRGAKTDRFGVFALALGLILLILAFVAQPNNQQAPSEGAAPWRIWGY